MSETKQGYKRCCGCKEELPATLEYFHKDSTKKDGLNGKCKKCMKEQNAKYYRQNKEILLEKSKTRRQKMKQKHTRRRAWERRKKRMEALPYELTEEQWLETLQEFDHQCAYCGSDGRGNPLQKDHIVSLERGGPFTKWNMIPACISCNSSKMNNDITDWYTRQPFYDPTRLARITSFMNKYRDTEGDAAANDDTE